MKNKMRPLAYATLLVGTFSSHATSAQDLLQHTDLTTHHQQSKTLATTANAINPGTEIQFDHRVQLSVNSSSFIYFVPQNNTPVVQHGTIVWDNVGDNWVYTPTTDYKGLDSFTYTDDQGDLKTVRLEVGLLGNSATVEVPLYTHYQKYSRLTPLVNGGFVVTWIEHLNSYDTVMFQRFNAAAEAVTGKIEVHDVYRIQSEPAIGYLSGGGYVISWRELNDVYARIYDGNNVPGATFRVNYATAGGQNDPAITTLDNNDFVIAFDDSGQTFRANIYSPTGTLKSENIELPLAIGGHHTEINVKALNNGGFMAMGSAANYIFTRTFDNSGSATGNTIVVSANTDKTDEHKQVTMTELPDGRYMVGWTSTEAQDGSLKTAMGRIYNADHTAVTDEFVINQYGSNNQQAVGLQVTHTGEFLAIWQSDAADGNGLGIMARRYDRDGNALSDEFRLTTNWQGNQSLPDIAMLHDGQIAVSYSDDLPAGNHQIHVAMVTIGGENEDIFQGYDQNDIFIDNGGTNKIYAGAGDDFIDQGTYAWGRDGDDTFYGGLWLYGLSGNDDFYAGPGNAKIYGGDDFDVVIFSGNYSDYLVEDKGNGRILVDDLRPGTPDGSRNTLFDVEAIEFADHRIPTEFSIDPQWHHLVQSATDVPVTIDFAALLQGSVAQSPQQGTLVFDSQSGTYLYTPNSSYQGIDSFTYQDGNGDTYTVRIEVGLPGNSSTLQVQPGLFQKDSRLAALTNGDFVVTWIEQFNGYNTVMYQRFNALGETLVSATEVHDVYRAQSEPAIGATVNGGFVIAWTELGNVQAKVYNLNNNIVQNTFIVNNATAGTQEDAAITTLPNHDFLIAWDAHTFFANLYTPNGVQTKQDILLSNAIGGIRSEVNIKTLPDGGFMAMGSADKYIVKRRFSHTGEPINSTSVVNVTDAINAPQQKQVTMAALPDGTYMMGWTATAGQDGSLRTVMGRIYNAQDQALTNEFVINQFSNNNQQAINIVATNSGDFLTVWQSDGADASGVAISGRRFDRNGIPLSDEFRIVGDYQGNQQSPGLNVLTNGQVALSYTDYSSGVAQIKVALISLGESGDDILNGDDQNNVLIGAGGYNTLSGGAGDDLLFDAALGFGDEGNDTFYHHSAVTGGAELDGGSGSDSVQLGGNYADHTVTDNGNGSFTVTDNRSGSPNGTLLLTHIETLVFADQSVSL